jgi:hypothetical protein
MALFQKLRGTLEALFQLGGNAGVTLKNNSGNLDVRNAADSAFAQVRVASTPVGPNDATSKTYVDGQVLAAGRPYIIAGVTSLGAAKPTTGTAQYFLDDGSVSPGAIYYDNGTTVTALPAANGRTISTIAGGSYLMASGAGTLDADAIYLYDSSTLLTNIGKWVKIGDISGVPTNGLKAIRFPIGTSNVSSTAVIPAGSRIHSTTVLVTTAYTAGTLQIGYTGATNAFMDVGDNILNALVTSQVEGDFAGNPSSNSAVTATFSGAAGGSGFVTVVYSSPLSLLVEKPS